MWDVSFLREIAVKIYECIGGKGSNFDSKIQNASTTMGYKQAVEAAGADWSKFKGNDPRKIDMASMGISAEDQQTIIINYINETEKTQYSRSAYADEYNPLFGAKIWRGIKGFGSKVWGGITGVGKGIANFFTGGGNDEDKESNKTTGSENKQKTQTTASKNESEKCRFRWRSF